MMRIIKKSLSLILLLFINNFCFSQGFDLGSWNIINVRYKLDEKWSVFGEVQLRSLKFYSDFHYHEYKGGGSYKLNNNVALTIGAGKYDTYKEGGNFLRPKNNDEFRVWPQIGFTQAIGNYTMEHRYRAEFRLTNTGFKTRYRYRLGTSYPFGKNKSGFKPYQINLSNEIFFTDKEPYFERNRAVVSLGYKITKQTAWQVGYLHQFDYKINDETGRDFLQIGLYVELSDKVNKSDKIAGY